MKAPTRQDYLQNRVSFAEYYRAVAKTAGISYRNADPIFLSRVRQALANGDEHLNTIPLREWDIRATCLLPSIRAAFRAHGDGDSLAGRVCLIKQAAIDAATETL